MKQLLLITLLFLCGLICTAQSNQRALRIGLMADMQYADKDSQGTRFYRNSLDKVDTAVQFLNQHKVDLSLILGDLVDQGPKDVPVLNKHLSVLKKPIYCLMGNHDYVTVSEPDQLYKVFGMPRSYYSFSKAKWRFILLNTNELTEYATTNNSVKRQTWKFLVDSLQDAGRKNTQPWNGGISREQLKWLAAELKLAEKNKEKVIVLTHHPLLPENGYETLNNRDIIQLINTTSVVKLVLSGHNHAGGFTLSNKIPYVTLEGMIETAKENAYGILELYSNEIKIVGKGRLTSRIFNF